MTPSIYKMVGSGAVTLANMRISAVAGTAFVDFTDSEAAANKLINHKGYLLKVRDSSKRAIQGYVKAQGTGETLDSDLVNAWAQSGFETWTPGVGSDITQAVNTTLAAVAYKAATATAGSLYKLVATITKASGTSPAYYWGTGASFGEPYFTFSTGLTTTTGIYRTATAAATHLGLYLGTGVATDFAMSGHSMKQVLTPSATGATITSTKGGSTFNYAALDSAFNYNDSSGYTYELWQVNNAVEVASGSIAANEMLADTTATNAFVAPVGVNLSAYQTGKYIFAAYNTVGGYAAFGYIKGTAPGGETLGAEIVDAWTNSGNPFETFDTTGAVINQAINSSGVAIAYKELASPAGKLYKCVNTYSLTSGTAPTLALYPRDNFNIPPGTELTKNATTYSTFPTAINTTSIGIRVDSNSEFSFSAFSLKNVTDCAATGALIVSAKDGATRSWAYKHASFDPNIATTYKIFYIGD